MVWDRPMSNLGCRTKVQLFLQLSLLQVQRETERPGPTSHRRRAGCLFFGSHTGASSLCTKRVHLKSMETEAEGRSHGSKATKTKSAAVPARALAGVFQ